MLVDTYSFRLKGVPKIEQAPFEARLDIERVIFAFVSFTSAEAMCKNECGNLASIHSEAQNSFLKGKQISAVCGGCILPETIMHP
ncbi:hypothetical protein ANCCAN_15169 [Ancylostoma caninum]|uniref:Uncharacterized protein n=1 Tax=Ancylostoma caninum TaxID=29170 RepID=A0A368G866_ANCCA|nr:hypothetical protein ANCCAN_15169 [Ancylostoma caninum]